jgi:hypothetical protein
LLNIKFSEHLCKLIPYLLYVFRLLPPGLGHIGPPAVAPPDDGGNLFYDIPCMVSTGQVLEWGWAIGLFRLNKND